MRSTAYRFATSQRRGKELLGAYTYYLHITHKDTGRGVVYLLLSRVIARRGLERKHSRLEACKSDALVNGGRGEVKTCGSSTDYNAEASRSSSMSFELFERKPDPDRERASGKGGGGGVVPIWYLVVHLYTVCVLISVALMASRSLNVPSVLGKGRDGKFPKWSLLIFFPYHLGLRAYVALRRRATNEPAYSKIGSGWYVGGWPYKPKYLPPSDVAVIDCTCELPRCDFVSSRAYICLPTWDTRSPSRENIEIGVNWALAMQAQGKGVFVHCAFGHGRSVAVLCAAMVAAGEAETWKEAEKMVKAVRPRIRMSVLQRQTLTEWTAQREAMQKK
ncbi:hypothetical protein CBR_g32363 [Chara braunii]|uniref:Tyrosine specific protein phosphatases domain-containing protein n=1 Tax=Chara braunii TaxID=69332 RepID=A0A388JY79_CHABU|nr:hypothetical protein CBR_g32363 [Chara braunii]|eukprot:GBG62774.1 hypothetical protein CBR_g32363 [Chara braunii]